MRSFRAALLVALGVLVLSAIGYGHFFGPVSRADATIREVLIEPGSTPASVAAQLKTEGHVRSTLATRIALTNELQGRPIRPGAYDVQHAMDTWRVAAVVGGKPRMVFVTIPPSVRKEQIRDLLTVELGWGPDERAAWDAATSEDVVVADGIYFPDTYLIPTDQPPAQIAARMRGRFMEVFAPYAAQAQQQGQDWKDILTLASVIDREAGKHDKHLVSGILWNRLNEGMRLQADATLQYIRGQSDAWWPVPQSEDKFLDSPFNTYKQAGLPPHPINNPTLASIEAALHPEQTPCLYYLHADRGQIYCALTYNEHKQNIDIHLR